MSKWNIRHFDPLLDRTTELSHCSCDVKVSSHVHRSENVLNTLNEVVVMGSHCSYTACFLSSHKVCFHFRNLKQRDDATFGFDALLGEGQSQE